MGRSFDHNGSQASSVWSQQSRKEKDYALQIKEALGVKRGQMLDAEQALILLDAVRAMDRNSSITREQITAKVMAYHAKKAEERPRPSEEDKSFIPVDHSASGPSVPPEEQPHRSPTATASKTAVTAVEERPRPSDDPARSWRKDAAVDRRAGVIPAWKKTCEPEDPTDKVSELAVRERRTAVHERRTRWSKGFDFFNAKFGLGQAEHEYLMSLWWET